MLRFHLGFPSPSIADLKMSDNAALARQAEQLGFDTIWHSNERFFREMFVRMTNSAVVTSNIGIGGAVSEPYAVHPALTAQSLATVHELSGGRATLALGAGGSGFPMMGIRRSRPAVALREAYTVIKALMLGNEITLEGEFIQAYHARLQFIPPESCQLWIASRGDRVLEACGEYADAVMLATYATPEGLRDPLALMRTGAARAGRNMDDIRLMSRVDTCVHKDPQTAYEGCRLMIARVLLASYPDRRFVERAGLHVPPQLEKVVAQRNYELVSQAADRVPDEFISAFCWAGTPEMVADRVIAMARGTGITEFGFWLLKAPGQSREEAMKLLADEVFPRLRQAIN